MILNFVDKNACYEKLSKQKPVNVVTDLISSLCDSLLNLQYCESLDNSGARRIEESTYMVINKCKQAGEEVGLEYDKSATILNLNAVYDYAVHNLNRNPARTFEELFNLFVEHYNL